MPMERNVSGEGSAGSDSDHDDRDSEAEGETRYQQTYDEEPDFSDPEDFVDDIDDAALMPDLLRQRPKESDGVDNVIIVDGIPCVGAERLEKLKSVLRKIFSKVTPFNEVIIFSFSHRDQNCTLCPNNQRLKAFELLKQEKVSFNGLPFYFTSF